MLDVRLSQNSRKIAASPSRWPQDGSDGITPPPHHSNLKPYGIGYGNLSLRERVEGRALGAALSTGDMGTAAD
jgi:hypothetical protein